MGKKLTGQPTGRPKAQIDPAMFEGMCRIQCTKGEMEAILGLDEKTITAWCKDKYGTSFSEVYKKHSAGGKMSLRRAQWKSGTEDRVPSMLIWLGKQHLGQTDKPEVDCEKEEAPQIFINFVQADK